MKKFSLRKSENHLKIEMKKEFFDSNLKSQIKTIKAVRVFNAIDLSDKIRISIFPIYNSNVESIEGEVIEKLNRFCG